MIIKQITVRGEVRLSRDFQSASSSFECVVDLEQKPNGTYENSKQAHDKVYAVMMEQSLEQAREQLENVLFGGVK